MSTWINVYEGFENRGIPSNCCINSKIIEIFGYKSGILLKHFRDRSKITDNNFFKQPQPFKGI